ncbi:MAG TPA: hypothetical protein VFG04_04095 [Planctomycetaceae bacterium]|jgi:hypothetical protein|nr:hypothetical protein [Planctomycetaceae bacterium]
MKFTFEVGQQEKHSVDFSWEKMLGVAKIWVDGELILKSRPLAFRELAQLAQLRKVSGTARYLSEMASGTGRPELTTGWTFEVGQIEKHDVRVEKERPQLLAAVRPHRYRIFIDDELTYEHVG